MFCRKCGTPNSEDAKFCEKCGAPLTKPAQGKNVPVNKGPETKKPKKKNTGKVILIIILILLLIASIAAAVFIGIKKKKEKDYNTEIGKAEKYLEKLDYEKAETAYLAAIEIDPKQPEPYIELAGVYGKQNKPEKAKSILKQGLEATKDKDIQKEYSYYEFTEEELLESLGESKMGTIELPYKRFSEWTAWVVPAEGMEGLANYRIMDFDNDGDNEILTLVIKREKNQFYDWQSNVLYLEMYEYTENGFEKTAEYKPECNVLGAADFESDGVFVKEHDGQLYIVGGLLSTTYMTADGSSFTVFVLSYDGKEFLFDAGYKEPISGSEFSGIDKNETNELAKKLQEIGLTKASAHISGNYMPNLIFEDDMGDVLFRVEGDNVGGDSSSYFYSQNIADLGKVVLKYWKDTVQPEESGKSNNDSKTSKEGDSKKAGGLSFGKLSDEEKSSLKSEIDALAAATKEKEKKNASMMEIRTDARDSLTAWEAMMDKVYKAVEAVLSDRKKDELSADQTSWEAEAEKAAQDAAAQFQGGTMEGLELVTNKYTSIEARCYELLEWGENH